MNAVVKVQNIMQAVDWSKYTLEEWLYQFGAWMNSVKGTCGRSINPIAIAMDEATKSQKFKKLGKLKQRQIIAYYIVGELDLPRPKSTRRKCEINDNEARAVQKLILDIQGQTEVLDQWMDAIVDRYFYGCSWAEMVTNERSQMDARSDVKCGLAVLHSRYSFIKFNKN